MRGGALSSKRSSPGIDRIVDGGGGIPYSDDDLVKICDGKVNVVSYKDVMRAQHVDQVLGKHGAAIMLYETRPRYGHWVALIRQGPDLVEFFDSYGMAPDQQLSFVPPQMNMHPCLEELFARSGVRCVWNKTKLQAEGQKVSTCGRWAALRIAWKYIPMQVFVKDFQGQSLKPDSYVTLLTLWGDGPDQRE
jgi:hypothetical protein